MKKKDYQEKLFELITKNGYWSDEVKAINDECLKENGAIKYRRWQDEVLNIFKG